MSNSHLVEMLNDDNEEVFTLIYKEHSNAVYNNIRKMVKNSDDAEDILQEVFVFLWNNRKQLASDQQIDGWLFSVSYYKSLEYLRCHLKRSIDFSYSEEKLSDLKDAESHITEKYEFDFIEKMVILQDGIEKLSERRKDAFVLCRIDGLSYEEAGKKLGVSSTTVKDYVKDATKLLRKYAMLKLNVLFAISLVLLKRILSI